MLSSSFQDVSTTDEKESDSGLASPSAMTNSIFHVDEFEVKDNLLKRSYDNPIFKTLIKNIKEGNIISAETALNAICIDEYNKVALGYALILSLECGQATNVGDLAVHKWAENDLPRALLFMQTRASTVQVWDGPDRESIYKLLIDLLAKKTELTLEEKSKEHLQTALTYMINKWEDYFEILLDNHLIVQEVNLDDLLTVAIKIGNSTAVVVLVEKGAKNISDALMMVHGYNGLSRVWWKKVNGYEIARRCLTTALALRPDFISVPNIELEKENIQHIVNNILKSKNIAARVPELKTLLLQGNIIRTVLNLDQLLLKSLELWHGDAVIIIAKAGAKNLPQALYWLQEKYSVLVSMVDGFYKTWGSGNWKETYKSLTYIAAGSWQQVFDESERGYAVYSEVTQQNIKLDENDKEILQVCLQNMIRDGHEEALILLLALHKTGLMRENISEITRHKLIQYSIEQGNGTVVRPLVDGNHLAEEDEWFKLVTHLEKLVSLFSITLSAPGCSYQELVHYFADLLISAKIDYRKTIQLESLEKLFKTIIMKGQYALFEKLIGCVAINNCVDVSTRQELFTTALETGEILIAKLLFATKPAFGIDDLGFKLNAIYHYQMNAEEISQKQPQNKKIDAQFCRILMSETLANKQLFESKFYSDEIKCLHNVVGHLIKVNSADFLKSIELQHVNSLLDYEFLLSSAVSAPNLTFVQHITHNSTLYRVKKLCILKLIEFSQAKVVIVNDHNTQDEYKQIRDYLLGLVLGESNFISNISDHVLEKTAQFSIMKALILSGEIQHIHACLKQHNHTTSEINRLLELAISYVPGDDLKRFLAIPILVEKIKSNIISSIEKMQALPIEIKNSCSNIYADLLRMLYLHIEELLSSEDNKMRFIRVVTNLLQLDANTQEDFIIEIIIDTRIHKCLGQHLPKLLPILKEPGHEKFLIALLSHADSSQLNFFAQSKKLYIAPIFLIAVGNNQHDFVDFCLKSVTNKDDLGLYDKAHYSPLVIALEYNAVKVLEILLQLDTVADMDTEQAIRIEMTRRSTNKQAWFIKPQPELSQALFERLMQPENSSISQRLLS